MFRSVIAAAMALALSAGPALAQGLWFNPAPNIPTGGKGLLRNPDYPNLFAPGAAWTKALSHISAFGVTAHFVIAGDPAEVAQVFAFEKAHGLKSLVVFPMIDAYQTGCGAGIEGMAHQAGATMLVVNKVRAAGGTIDYLAMDEPLYFGHFYDGVNACKFDIPTLASQVASNFWQVQVLFPNAKLVDTEPVVGTGQSAADWQTWIKQLRVLKAPPTAVTMDVQWNRAWSQPAKLIVAALHSMGVPYDLIADGSGLQTTGSAWVSAAEANVGAWSKAIAAKPAHVLFESWNPVPDHLLPETDPSTLPYLIDWYAASQK